MKLKCCGCKERFDSETMSKLPKGNFHSINCAIQYAGRESAKSAAKQIARAERVKKKEAKKRKADFYANDTKTRKAAAKLHCHRFIRYRDKDKGCASCDRPLVGKYDAGHFLESGNYSSIRYHEDNIHGQCVYCNQHKGGNSADYEKRLRARIGDKRVQYLIDRKCGIVKRDAQYYMDIENHYKQKLKDLVNGQG